MLINQILKLVNIKKYIILEVILSTIVLFATAGTAYIYKIFINIVIGEKNIFHISIVLISWITLYCISWICKLFLCKNEIFIQNEYISSMRSKLINKIYNTDNLEDSKVLLFDYVKDTDRYVIKTVALFISILLCAVYIMLILLSNIRMAILILLLLPVMFIITYYVSKKMKNISKKYNKLYAIYEKDSFNLLSKIHHIKANNAEEFILNRFKEQWKERNTLYTKRFLIWCFDVTIFAFKEHVISQILIFCLGGYLLLIKKIELVDFIVIVSYNTKLVEELVNVNSIILERINEKVFLKRIISLLSMQENLHQEMKNSNEEFNIKVKNLSFNYGDTNILSNINLTIEQNGIYAIVGASGSGKTTLIKLLLKILTGYVGSIYINGNDINKLKFDDIYQQVTVILQDMNLFNTSIKKNLLIEGGDENELEKVCRISCLYDDIMKFPNKWDTEIGENGINLSGGQRQKLAIARALMKKAKIIILDEATSNIDIESEKLILDYLKELAQDHIILIISHRFSMLDGLSKVFVLKEGILSECDMHEFLQEAINE